MCRFSRMKACLPWMFSSWSGQRNWMNSCKSKGHITFEVLRLQQLKLCCCQLHVRSLLGCCKDIIEKRIWFASKYCVKSASKCGRALSGFFVGMSDASTLISTSQLSSLVGFCNPGIKARIIVSRGDSLPWISLDSLPLVQNFAHCLVSVTSLRRTTETWSK